mmetsp:Transcript_15376/g.23665  ORF Transcript_15376/g.23665 Transcript_15376/m.23665 type:complete len:82 (-) Transcript_15376:1420-1665(-)
MTLWASPSHDLFVLLLHLSLLLFFGSRWTVHRNLVLILGSRSLRSFSSWLSLRTIFVAFHASHAKQVSFLTITNFGPVSLT